LILSMHWKDTKGREDLTFYEIGTVVDTSFTIGHKGISFYYKMFITWCVRKYENLYLKYWH